MPRVLLVAETTGYQIRSFVGAAERLGVEIVLASDRCHVLEDPWRDQAIPITFLDETEAVQSIRRALADRPTSGVVAVGDHPALIAALAAEALWLSGNPPDAVRISGNKLLTRRRLRDAELPCPWFTSVGLEESAQAVAERVSFPCVVKPLSMSASRGVVRADTPEELETAMTRSRQLLRLPNVQALRDPAMLAILVEKYLPGREVALEGLLTKGALQTLAVFDKPDPLEGPFFEETIYVTPAAGTEAQVRRYSETVAQAAAAIGLTDGPVHAECRVSDDAVFVLEVAPRPIGGLCSRVLRFTEAHDEMASLEEVLLRHALTESVAQYRRETLAAGVMMIPIPEDGRYKGVDGLEHARAVDHVEEIVITAKRDQRIQPLPEGGSYLGFIFARADTPDGVVSALRAAHSRLRFEIAAPIPIL